MGMFDSFIDSDRREWQTKAVLNSLSVPLLDAFVTIRGGVVEAVGVPRDETLPRMVYSGGPLLPIGRESW